MRLLKRLQDGGFELMSVSNDKPPPYAILSHTWIGDQEVTYKDLVNGTGGSKSGYNKIRFCSDQAATDGLEYFWVDTCCINKSDVQELSTAINSMFRWYQGADKCYVYLLDVSLPDNVANAEDFQMKWLGAFRESRWFTRGWTLQELLAPPEVEFFCKQGKYLGSRESLLREIHEVTAIPLSALQRQSLDDFSVEERICWAAKRVTTLKEDKVYCLLGIFGVYLPLIYGEGEAYAELRLREEIHRRQIGPRIRNSCDLSVLSSLPFPRNESFVGRTDELSSLEQSLLQSHTHQRTTIYGLGGCGKSALAIEFAYHAMSEEARLVFWVLAISQESFELAYREIGLNLHIPGIDKENVDIKELVHEYLSSDHVGRWLIVVDNADNPDVLLGSTDSSSKSTRLIDYLPRSNRGAILFTTRSRKAAVALTQNSVQELTSMGKSEAHQLFSHRLADTTLLNDATAIDEFLERLTYLPLAIVQAAAFMNSNNVSVTDYISLFNEAGANTELFHEPFVDPGRYAELDNTIARTWHISFDQMCKQDPIAANYLSFMACIDRVNIPQSLVAGSYSSVQQTKALGTLLGYAFLTERQQTQETGEDRYFDMHRLVHMASVWWLDRQNLHIMWVNTAAAELMALLDNGSHRNMKVWMAYLPHATHVATNPSLIGTAAIAALLYRVGTCQTSLGRYSEAEITHRQVLQINKRTLGPEHPDTLTNMQGLAESLVLGRKHAEAEKIQRKTLELRLKVSGVECRATIEALNHLASNLSTQGKMIEAEKLFGELLNLTRRLFGEEHPSTVTGMHNMAAKLSNQGKYAEAEEVYRKVLRLRNQMYEEEDPSTLTSMNCLAGVLKARGKYDEAEEIYRSTLKARKKVLGDKHPSTLFSMRCVANVVFGNAQYVEAEKLYRDTLRLSLEALGDKHPMTLSSMSNIALVLAHQFRYDESRCMYEQAYSGYSDVLGEDHLDTRHCKRDYYNTLWATGKDLTPAEKEDEAKGRESLTGDESQASIAVPLVASNLHTPFIPVADDRKSKQLGAATTKQSGWRHSPLLRSAKSKGFMRAVNLLRGRTSLPESQG